MGYHAVRCLLPQLFLSPTLGPDSWEPYILALNFTSSSQCNFRIRTLLGVKETQSFQKRTKKFTPSPSSRAEEGLPSPFSHYHLGAMGTLFCGKTFHAFTGKQVPERQETPQFRLWVPITTRLMISAKVLGEGEPEHILAVTLVMRPKTSVPFKKFP